MKIVYIPRYTPIPDNSGARMRNNNLWRALESVGEVRLTVFGDKPPLWARRTRSSVAKKFANVATFIHPVIHCLGSITPLWRLSCGQYSKQLHPPTGPRSMPPELALRLKSSYETRQPIMIENES